MQSRGTIGGGGGGVWGGEWWRKRTRDLSRHSAVARVCVCVCVCAWACSHRGSILYLGSIKHPSSDRPTASLPPDELAVKTSSHPSPRKSSASFLPIWPSVFDVREKKF